MKNAPQGLLRTPLAEQGGTINRAWLYFLLASDLDNLPVYADNAAAKAGGLKANQPYRTGGDPDLIAVVH